MYKVSANRLTLVIDKVILESQSIFVIGKQIMDEILVANKVVDYAK
jgi:hypothetical protein